MALLLNHPNTLGSLVCQSPDNTPSHLNSNCCGFESHSEKKQEVVCSAGWFSADNLLFPGQLFGFRRPLQINVFPLIVEMSQSASSSSPEWRLKFCLFPAPPQP